MTIAAYLGEDEKDVKMESVGLNHLGWVRRVTLKGRDIMPKLIEFLSSAEGPANIPDVAFPPEVITSLSAVPLYYNRYYYNTASVFKEISEKPKTRAQEVMEIEEALLAQYRDPEMKTKPVELSRRGGAFYSKIAVDVLNSIFKDTGDEHVVNTNNRGAIPDLPPEAVVEINCGIGENGATPIPAAPLEASMRALVQRAKAYEDLTIEAALKKSRSAAFRAIITNPLGPLAENATAVLDDMFRVNGFEYK
jgi:6-phospho-beta-glucosidase